MTEQPRPKITLRKTPEKLDESEVRMAVDRVVAAYRHRHESK